MQQSGNLCETHKLINIYIDKSNPDKKYCKSCQKNSENIIFISQFRIEIQRKIENTQQLSYRNIERLNQILMILEDEQDHNLREIKIRTKKIVGNQKENTVMLARISLINYEDFEGLFQQINGIINQWAEDRISLDNLSRQISDQFIPQKEQIFQTLSGLEIQISEFQENQLDQKQKNSQISLQFIKKKYSIETFTIQEEIYSSSFNSDSSLLFLGGNKKIFVLKFDQCEINRIQKMENHKSIIHNLNFCTVLNQLISSCDSFLIFWITRNNQWVQNIRYDNYKLIISNQKLKVNESLITSYQKNIQFWVIKNQQYSIDQVLKIPAGISCASVINNKYLLCCFDNKELRIYQKNQIWQILNVLKLDNTVLRSLFIQEEVFIIQKQQCDHIEVFLFNNMQNMFGLRNQIKLQNCTNIVKFFPFQYNSNRQTLVCQNASSINFIFFDSKLDQQFIETIFLTQIKRQEKQIFQTQMFPVVDHKRNKYLLFEQKVLQ